MALDIHSKSGLSFHIGYSGFMFMRNALMESLCPGFGALHWWAVNCRNGYMPFLKQKGWDDVLDCEMWEVFEALVNGDKEQAVEELYDMAAVILRTIDVIEGRQKLGKPAANGVPQHGDLF